MMSIMMSTIRREDYDKYYDEYYQEGDGALGGNSDPSDEACDWPMGLGHEEWKSASLC